MFSDQDWNGTVLLFISSELVPYDIFIAGEKREPKNLEAMPC